MMTQRRNRRRLVAGLATGITLGQGAMGTGRYLRQRRSPLGKLRATATASKVKTTSFLRSKIGGYSERLGAALAAKVKARRPPVRIPATRLGRAGHYLKNSRFGRFAIRKGVNATSGLGAKILRTRAARRFMADLI